MMKLKFFSKLLDKRIAAYQRELIETHYKEVDNMYRQMRGWRHDYRGHIQTMKVLAAQGDLDGIKAYLDALDTDLNTVDLAVKTGNAMADAIINSKISLAKSRNIPVQIDAHIPVKLKMSELDLCCILGNLFDNAMDASAELPEEERLDKLSEYGLSVNIPNMKADLKRYGIEYDQWFFESSLHESGYVADSVQALTDLGYTYEKDGALWLNTSRILAENLKKAGKSDADIEKLGLKDDVLRRANGFYTYFAADIAYHRNKFAVRGFDKVINVWGADHHGHVARLKGAMDALGLDGEHRLDIVLMQLVKLVRDGEVVRMSKRTGKAISLTDLLDEIPVDACRYFFNAKPETQMEFDLGLAVREDSENPVYYVQYAHARICTLLKALEAEGYTVPAAGEVDFSLLSGEAEQALIKKIAAYSQVVRLAARDYDPSHINRYLTELAGDFHRFYTACRIKGEERPVLLARLKLADTARSVLKNAMTLIGCTAPEKM